MLNDKLQVLNVDESVAIEIGAWVISGYAKNFLSIRRPDGSHHYNPLLPSPLTSPGEFR